MNAQDIMPQHKGADCAPLLVYVAASFAHLHGVRLLGRELRAMGCQVLDWTEKASPPPGLTPVQRRIWMDTDREGGQVYAFCRDACFSADLVIYYGASGQDAGVEVGLAVGAGAPVLGIRGPLEGPGLMLHGAASLWVDSIEAAIAAVRAIMTDVPARKSLQPDSLAALKEAVRRRKGARCTPVVHSCNRQARGERS